MVAKEKLLIFIATIIVIFIIAALVFPAFSNMLPLENPFLQGKDAFIRYYACSLAICTQGCNWLSSNDICLKRNIWGNCTMTCKTEICDKQPGFGNCGNKGMCCNETYSIYLPLKGNARFSVEKVYNWGTGPISIDFVGTEIHQIMDKLNKSPKEKKPQFPLNILSPSCPFFTATRSKAEGTFYKMGNDDPFQIRDWSQTGAIYMLPDQAEPYFTCIDYDKDLGYSECTFKGYLQIYSLDPNKDNCADVVVINGQDPFTGDFAFYATNGGMAKIPIDHTSPIALYILNGLGFSETFTMQVISPLPAGITCDFGGEDTTKINGLQDTKVGTPNVPLTCKPTALPPPGGFEVWVKAWDGTKTHAIKLKIDVGNFELTLVSPSPLIINAGNSGSFIFDLTNTIGIDVTFQLTSPQSPDNDVGCTFSGGITSIDVADSATKQITLNCAPNSNARNKDYVITVTATYDTTKRTAVSKVTVPNCTVTNLALHFLNSAGMETTTIESADAVKLKADGFSGCQNMNVRFILSVGSKLLYQNSVDTSGDSFYSNSFKANSPEKWEMYVQMDENNDGIYEKESPRKNLTINAPAPAGYGGEGNTDRCGYGLGEASCCSFYSTSICDQCGGCIPIVDWHPVDHCNNCLDPQSCFNTQGYYSSASSVCCIKDSNTYSPGPTDAPCLSPDTITTNDQPQNSNIQWREVDDPRDVLVYEPNPTSVSQAVFKRPDCGSDVNNCKDTLGLIDAVCGNFDSNTYHSGNECKIKNFPDADWYTSWLLVKVSDDSRPVYGIKIIPQKNLNGFWFSVGASSFWVKDSAQMKFTIFRHKMGVGWFKVQEVDYSGGAPPDCYWPCPIENTINLKPDPAWSWENTDALLIGYKYGTYTKVNNLGDHISYTPNPTDGEIDYIGLLTKDNSNIPYCTDGPNGATSPSTYRTVDNGKMCYWRVDCDTVSGNGWDAPNYYSYIGPFEGTSICNCETDTNNCGDGVCAPDGINYRFDNVRCVYGGWMGNLVKI